MLDFLDNIEIRIGRKHCRVHGCLVREEYTDGENDERGKPHSDPWRDFATFGHLLAYDGNHKVESEKDNRDYQRNADAAFSDDGSERCSDEKEKETCQGKGEFPMPLNLIGKEQNVININDVERRTTGVYHFRGTLGSVLQNLPLQRQGQTV